MPFVSNQFCNAESLTARPSVQGMPSVFEKARYRLEHERVLLLETLLLFQSDAGASMAPEDWLKLASSVASALYARGPMLGLEGSTENAQYLVSSASNLVLTMQAEAMLQLTALLNKPAHPYKRHGSCMQLCAVASACLYTSQMLVINILYAVAGHTSAYSRPCPRPSTRAGCSREVHLRKQPSLCQCGSSAEGP